MDGIKEKGSQNNFKMNILTLLDQQIEGFKQSNGNYPSKIIMSKETKDKVFAELEEIALDNSWKDFKGNYRGILLEIRDIDFIKLEG